MSIPPLLCPINADQPDKVITAGHLRLGGTDPHGHRLGVTNTYLTWDDRPLTVISGEFHYSRCQEADWEEALLKMKAGGLNTVATYVFWIFHEEQPGVFAWDGPKNVRRFVALCARHGLYVILRIGPFAHGEWRNGGLPDWLYGQPFEVRSNAPGYLAYVERFYAEIGRQVQGLLFKDGGPIIGLQLENEYMHAGAPWEVVDPVRAVEWVSSSREGAAHLQALKALAQRAGLDTPLYLVTAWGSPIVEDETLPVYGGYAYPVWLDNPAPSRLYLFRDGHAHPAEAPTHRVPAYYPLIYAEMQGGIQVRYHQRPVVPPRSVEALALVCIGNGSAWLGYYMYHGGTTPRGGHGFSHERLHPQRSYDFQAPLSEYGERQASYHALRLLHLFLGDYGEALAPMGTVLPEGADALEPENTTAVRYCLRAQGGAGFLFVNNFQDHVTSQTLPDVVFALHTASGELRIPETGSLMVLAEAGFILPFNQKLGDAHLVYATAQPLAILRGGDRLHYFYFAPEGLTAEYCFAKDTVARVEGDCEPNPLSRALCLRPRVGQNNHIDLTTAQGQALRITTLTRQEAEQAWKGEAWGAERLIISPANLTFVDGRVEARRTDSAHWPLHIWPPVMAPLTVGGAQSQQTADGSQTVLELSQPAAAVPLRMEPVSDRKCVVRLPEGIPSELSDVFLRIDYEGDTGLAFIDGELVADNFNNGTPWRIGLKRFTRAQLQAGLCLVFSPVRQGTVRNVSSALAGRFEFEGEEKLVVHSISAIPEYRASVQLAAGGWR